MLNAEQAKAVRYIDGPLLVLAGAGSGKTRVITQKMAYLIETCGYKASNVFAVTFTNKAAHEMRERIASALPKGLRRGLNVSTFHTLGLRMLKRNVSDIRLKTGFSIFDSEDCLQVLKQLLPVHQAQDKAYLAQVQSQISRWKNDLLRPEEAHIVAINKEEALLYQYYQETLEAYNAVDFDDLIRLPVMLLRHNPEILAYWQNRVRHLLIDEYQDANISQYELVKLLVGTRSQFTVVGDDDQSIYAWRGARPENLAQLQADFPRLQVIKLEQNYRSTTRILQAANHLIANNPHLFTKALWSEHGAGDLIRVICCRDESDEAEQVVADLISHKLRHQTQYGDYAILYRGNHQSRVFEKVLRSFSINYHISGGQSWFAKAEVRDIFAYLKLLCNEQDDAAFLRAVNTPKRGVGTVSLEALRRYADMRGMSLYQACDHMALGPLMGDKQRALLAHFKHLLETLKTQLTHQFSVETLKQLVEDHGYEAYIYEQCDTPAKAQKRMDNVWELLDWVGRLMAKNPEGSLADVINKLILIDILEQSDDKDGESVQLLTLHASKGLEYPFVYLVGMEEELLPHRVSIDTDQIEEERRLCYVGITRAQKALCLTLARQRRKAGELSDCQPSRFLEELPEEALEWFGKSGERNEAQSKALAKNHLQGLKALLQG